MRSGIGHRLALGLYTLSCRLALPMVRRRRRHYRDAAMARERAGELELPAMVRQASCRLWIHGASVGEIKALPPIIGELRRRLPEAAILVSALTDTGLDAAREIDGIDLAFSLPVDLPTPVSRALQVLRPTVLCVLETELWPRLLSACHAGGIPVVVMNGKLAAQTARSYRLLGPLFRPLLARVTAVAAQSGADKKRFADLGVPADAITVAGSSKIDVLPVGSAPTAARAVAGRTMVVAGSIRAGEEQLVLDAWRALPHFAPAPLLVLAPRHLDHLAAVERQIERHGLTVGRRSRLHERLEDALIEAAEAQVDILLLDTLGELAAVYQYGSVAIVGGGMRSVGGHNLLEPAVRGRPVLFGAHHVGVAGEEAILVEAGGGWRCADGRALAAVLTELLADPERAWDCGRRAAVAVAGARGAAVRAVDFVFARLGWATSPAAGGQA